MKKKNGNAQLLAATLFLTRRYEGGARQSWARGYPRQTFGSLLNTGSSGLKYPETLPLPIQLKKPTFLPRDRDYFDVKSEISFSVKW
jgi:hypothetical protein